MRLFRRHPPPALIDIQDFDEVNYDVLVHVPLGAPQPSAATITEAVCVALDLPPERVQTRAFFPWMGG
jgi:hypothetical protein